MIQSFAYADYWAFAVAVLIGLALVHLRLRRMGTQHRISGADWVLVFCALTLGWLAIDQVVKWEDARISEVIQRLVVPLHARGSKDDAHDKVIRDTEVLFSRTNASEHPVAGTIAGEETESLGEAQSFPPPEVGYKNPWRKDEENPGPNRGPVLMSGPAGSAGAVVDVDYVNRKKAESLSAMQSMATAVVAALFLAIMGIVGYLRVRDDFLLSEIRNAHTLAESEARFRLLFNASPDPILVTDPDGFIRDGNPAACEILKLEPNQLTRLHLIELVDRAHLEDAIEKFNKLAAGEIDHVEDICFSSSEGSQIHVELCTRNIRFPENPARLVHVHDLTNRIALEYELRQTQKMDGIGQLAAGVAHDFNNLLTVIQGHTLLLLEDENRQDHFLASLHEVACAADRAAELTTHLLTFGRKQQMRLEILDANEVLKNFLRLLGRVIPEHIDVTLRTSKEAPLIRADRGLIEQVVVNLAVNARDAMPDGGALKLSTSFREIGEEGAPEKTGAKPGKYVVITIEDTGEGMDELTKNRIFEPFFTTKDVGKGTGLGLASAYGIIAQHGGWMHVDSVPGEGTAFSILLPARETSSIPVEAPPAVQGEIQGGTETILVVEDEPALRELAALNLERFGYRVIKAASGREALLIWGDIKEDVDLLLTDLVMPDGVSGRELGERIGADNNDLPIVYMSGYSGDVTGFGDDDDFDSPILKKPYTPNDLARRIRSTLDAA